MKPFLNINIEKELHTAEGKFPLSVNFSVEKGEFIALTGPSGGGKTTLLRIIAGLENAENGTIIFDDKTWLNTYKKKFLVPQKRPIGFVFQNYALFPNMTIRQNLTFALNKNVPKNRVEELIELIDLSALANRYPHQLSGGQQQRVALARALVRQPKILLLDEPLSALDTTMRQRLQDDLKRLHEAYELTTILVSHDEREVFKLANRVIVIESGKIIESGSPQKILQDKGAFITIKEIFQESDFIKIIGEANGKLVSLSLPVQVAKKYQIGEIIFIS